MGYEYDSARLHTFPCELWMATAREGPLRWDRVGQRSLELRLSKSWEQLSAELP